MLILKLVLRRIGSVAIERLSFRLRYLIGFAFFALILWLLKVILPVLIDMKSIDSIKSDQFIWLEEERKSK